ncbi:MAG: 16S rRNA (guanine(966)-N(2))-methyltransferase RsmD [Candidatus Cloacimonadota bacterium]|nr:MAG: 16S rRNA (guanine(966)-N(2))-methyltransferase RsmD [Candidatus Cloacimonadota bacterium]
MRIISGKFKKANLFSVPGNTTRPTSDAVKEMIFSTLFDCKDSDVLDLYAGSGSLGLEALSRGAGYAEFVDGSQKSVSVIGKNIEKLNCKKQTRINRKKVLSFLGKCEKKYDLIFLDPPYNKGLINPTIEKIIEFDILKPGGRVVAEYSKKEKLKDFSETFEITRKEAGLTHIIFMNEKNCSDENTIL